MNGSRERDKSVERLLRRSLRTAPQGGVTAACLDAETLAAWMDGGLSGDSLEMAREHVAACARCQSLVGVLTRLDQVVPRIVEPEPEPVARRWSLAWLVPLTAAAAAVALYVAVPRNSGAPAEMQEVRTPPEELRQDTGRAEADKAGPQSAVGRIDVPAAVAPAPAPSAGAAIAAAAPAPATPPAIDASPAAPAPPVSSGSFPATGSAARAASPAPPAGSLGNARALALERSDNAAVAATRIEIVSPDPRVRWRIVGSLVEHSVDGGTRWTPLLTGNTDQLAAGTAPSASVCWLVGKAGAVLLTTDAVTWRRVTSPEMTDLSSVRATDERAASVTSVDGRTFTTTDGGATWIR